MLLKKGVKIINELKKSLLPDRTCSDCGLMTCSLTVVSWDNGKKAERQKVRAIRLFFNCDYRKSRNKRKGGKARCRKS